MRFPALLMSLLLLSVAEATAQSPIRYAISFANRAHHEAVITVSFTNLDDRPLQLRMSRSSPGRYALHEFAKNVYNFRATGEGGRTVTVSRPNPHQWDVAGHGGAVSVTYTLYGDHADGTYSGIDRTHAHLNMPATFMWARGTEQRPIELAVHVPDGSGWRVATQLAATDDPLRFEATDLQYFLDSPTEVSDFWLRTWQFEGQSFRVALHHEGSETDAEQYATATAAIVEAAEHVFGELPTFDYGEYTFLACYLPWVDGDGMEHRNSTVLTSTSSLESNMNGVLGTVAHEFFHAWNVERIRPRTLQPFDFERANMSGELWFAEGFTSYYDDVFLWRASLIDDETFAGRMGGIANNVSNARGRQFFSPVEMSRQAPFVDAATAVDPNNRNNTFLSYYTWGSGIALALDLTLRADGATDGRSVTLDDVMREMWRTHGVTEIPYEVPDVEAALARVTDNPGFARDFFDRYVRGREAPDFQSLLAAAGIVLAPGFPERAWLGSGLQVSDGEAIVTGTPTLGSPLFRAGLDRGDRVLDIGGETFEAGDALQEYLESRAVGDVVTVRFESRGQNYEREMTLGIDPTLAGTLRTGGASTATERDFLGRWKAGSEE
jgi:predicted metalloprotease with PDZ domain